MLQTNIDSSRLKVYLESVFRDPKDKDAFEKVTKVKRDRTWAEHFFDEGVGTDIAGVRGTLWAAYNGVTELVDHRVKSFDGRTISTSDSQRLNNVWFGTGAKTKELAYKVAVEKLEGWRN